MLGQFNYTIAYRRTADHGNADVLSHLPASNDATFDEGEDEDDVQMVCVIDVSNHQPDCPNRS